MRSVHHLVKLLTVTLLFAGVLPGGTVPVRADGAKETVAGTAGAPSLLDYALKRLDAPEVESLRQFEGKPVLMMFFEPECSWCFRQVRTLNAMGQRCTSGFQALAVGVNGNRSDLKKELRRLRPDFPAFEASPALLEALDGVPATPFTLIGDAKGDYLNWTRGYLPEADLEIFLAGQGIQVCATEPAGNALTGR